MCHSCVCTIQLVLDQQPFEAWCYALPTTGAVDSCASLFGFESFAVCSRSRHAVDSICIRCTERHTTLHCLESSTIAAPRTLYTNTMQDRHSQGAAAHKGAILWPARPPRGSSFEARTIRGAHSRCNKLDHPDLLMTAS